jgi:predicted Zn-dependent protease
MTPEAAATEDSSYLDSLNFLSMKKSEIFLPKVAAKPDNMLFRFSLGQALYDEGTTEAAIPHLQSCTDSRDDWMLPRILLGKALLQHGQADRAKLILEHALQLAVSQHHDEPAKELRSILEDL